MRGQTEIDPRQGTIGFVSHNIVSDAHITANKVCILK